MLKWFKKTDDAKDGNDLANKLSDAAYHLIEENERLEREYKQKIRSVQKERNDLADENSKLKKKIVRLEKECDFHLLRYKRQEWLIEQPEEFRRPIDNSELSVRVSNVLKNSGIKTYADLTEKTKAELLREPNFGSCSLAILRRHVLNKFPDHHLSFSMFEGEAFQ